MQFFFFWITHPTTLARYLGALSKRDQCLAYLECYVSRKGRDSLHLNNLWQDLKVWEMLRMNVAVVVVGPEKIPRIYIFFSSKQCNKQLKQVSSSLIRKKYTIVQSSHIIQVSIQSTMYFPKNDMNECTFTRIRVSFLKDIFKAYS